MKAEIARRILDSTSKWKRFKLCVKWDLYILKYRIKKLLKQ